MPPALDDCWNRIGVRGDRSCPELVRVLHCRNCPVQAEAGRGLLEREPPPGFRREAAAAAARAEAETPVPAATGAAALSALVFRVSGEDLALPLALLREVAAPAPIHSVPHRGGLLLGLVNIRGELLPAVSLGVLLGLPPRPASTAPAAATDPAGRRRLVVVGPEDGRWVLPLDAVHGIEAFERGAIEEPPAVIGRCPGHFSQAVLPWRQGRVALLDPERLLDALAAGIGPP